MFLACRKRYSTNALFITGDFANGLVVVKGCPILDSDIGHSVGERAHPALDTPDALALNVRNEHER